MVQGHLNIIQHCVTCLRAKALGDNAGPFFQLCTNTTRNLMGISTVTLTKAQNVS